MNPPPTLVVLAAGRSTRFGRLKQLAPIGPGGEALLDYALHDAALAGFTRFLLVIQETLRPDFDARLRDAATHLDIRYAHQRLVKPGLAENPPPGRTRPWGTGFAVLTAGEKVDGPFAVCNADDFYGPGAYAALAGAMRDDHRAPGHAVHDGEATASYVDITQCDADITSNRAEAPRSPALARSPPASTRDAPGTKRSLSASTRDARAEADPDSRPPGLRGLSPARAIVIGYPLKVTLSENGGVSRGLCDVDESGVLRGLTEGLELRRDGDRAVGRDVAGRPLEAPLRTPVCTNLWGFQPEILPPLRDLFAGFLAAGPGLDREFHLSEAMNELIAAGRARCTLLPTRERWLGVTFPGDQAGVAESLRGLVDSGVYPMRLRDAWPTLHDARPTLRDVPPNHEAARPTLRDVPPNHEAARPTLRGARPPLLLRD